MNGSKRGRGLAILIVLGAVQLVAGCQDGYPIAPTHCDRWCDLVQKTFCGSYDPASCVVLCEEGFSGAGCDGEWDELFGCLEMNQSNIECGDPANDGNYIAFVAECQVAKGNLFTCLHPDAPNNDD